MSNHQNELLREMQYEHCAYEAERIAEQEAEERHKATQLLFDADYNQHNIYFREFFTLEQLINLTK